MERGIIRRIVIGVVAILLIAASCYLLGFRKGRNRANLPINERVDTLLVFDTILVNQPVYRETRVVEKVLIPVADTIRLTDTLYLIERREQIHWKDSLSSVYASGIDVEVDSVLHHIPTIIVTKEREVPVKLQPKWGVGLQVGYGFSMGTQIQTAPYIGIGLQYNIISW